MCRVARHGRKRRQGRDKALLRSAQGVRWLDERLVGT